MPAMMQHSGPSCKHRPHRRIIGALYVYPAPPITENDSQMQGRTYLCKKLDLSSKVAVVRPADLKYYTKTRDFTDVYVVGGKTAYHKPKVGFCGTCDCLACSAVPGMRLQRSPWGAPQPPWHIIASVSASCLDCSGSPRCCHPFAKHSLTRGTLHTYLSRSARWLIRDPPRLMTERHWICQLPSVGRSHPQLLPHVYKHNLICGALHAGTQRG